MAEVRRAEPGFESDSVTWEALQHKVWLQTQRTAWQDRQNAGGLSTLTSKCLRTTAWLLSNSACPGDVSAKAEEAPACQKAAFAVYTAYAHRCCRRQ